MFDSTSQLDELKRINQASSDVGGDLAISLYGTSGTPTHLSLSEEILRREGGAGVALAPSGLAAITVALFAVLKAGDHILITDSAYGPLRNIAQRLLPKLGMEYEFYDPLIGGKISTLIRANTRCIWVESPGSLTFEIQVNSMKNLSVAYAALTCMEQDIPAITSAAHKANCNIAIVADNT